MPYNIKYLGWYYFPTFQGRIVMKLKHVFLVFSLLYSFLALAVDTDKDQDTELEATTEEEAVTTTPTMTNENITSRLKDEMDFLHQSVEGTPAKAQTVSSNSTAPAAASSSMEDLEEKINFRSAAVKKADNHESEVNVDELDSENFE